MDNIEQLVKAYVKYWEEYIEQEEYKWEALAHFQLNWKNKIPIYDRISNSLIKAKNLLNSQNYTPRSMLKKVCLKKPKEVSGLMAALFDENDSLESRVQNFITGFEDLVYIIAHEQENDWDWLDKLENNKLSSYQDPHAISVYLFMRHPESHYIYKSRLFDTFAEMSGYSIQEKDRIKKYVEYERFCDSIKKVLLTETDFINNTYEKWLNSHKYFDPNYNLLTQDFIYTVCIHLNGDYYAKSGNTTPKVVNVDVIPSTSGNKTTSIRTATARVTKNTNYLGIYENNKRIGLNGELWVLNYEKERLQQLGISHNVEHSSIVRGDGLGYDILSVEDDGVTERYIEVKTTTGSENQPFFFSDNELRVSQQYKEHFYLYRVYGYDEDSKSASVIIKSGSLDNLNARPISFTASL